MTEEQLVAAFRDLVGENVLLSLGVLILANFVLGVINALKDGRFTLEELAGILRKVWPYLGGALVLLASGEAIGGTMGNTLKLFAWLANAPFAVGVLKEAKGLGLPIDKVLGKTLDRVVATKPPSGPGLPPSPIPLDRIVTEAIAKGLTGQALVDYVKAEAEKVGIKVG